MKKLIVAMITCGLLFVGCTPIYNVTPKYNKDSQTVVINNTIFKNAIQKDDRHFGIGQRGGHRTNIQYYKLRNEECKNIHYEYVKAGNKTYITYSEYERILEYFIGGSCNVTQISNLKFLSCRLDNSKNELYYITTDTKNKWGYNTLQKLSLNRSCFKKIKENTVIQAKKDKVEIKSYIDKIDLPKDTKIYDGVLVLDKNRQVKCPSNTKIKLFVSKNNKLFGQLSFIKTTGKSGTSRINGNINRFLSRDVSFVTIEKNKEIIRGTFKSNNCSGIFNAKIHK
ncbi:MAG: hypothetical protein HRT42_01300 [Campylobacteraceae bacterium]|nr:hypothetical protein [Campylobacteraceae bacterium]